MLEILPDVDESDGGQGQLHLTEDKPRCSLHSHRESDVLCLTCRTGLCTHCMISSSQGGHVDHDLHDFDDARSAVRKMINAEAKRLKDIHIQSTQLCESANLSDWKSSIEKAVGHRAKEARARIKQWREDMYSKIQDLFVKGCDQVPPFSMSKKRDLCASKLETLDDLSTLEACKELGRIKNSLNKLESELKVYQNARLVTQDSLSGTWTVKLGDIQSNRPAAHNGIHKFCTIP